MATLVKSGYAQAQPQKSYLLFDTADLSQTAFREWDEAGQVYKIKQLVTEGALRLLLRPVGPATAPLFHDTDTTFGGHPSLEMHGGAKLQTKLLNNIKTPFTSFVVCKATAGNEAKAGRIWRTDGAYKFYHMLSGPNGNKPGKSKYSIATSSYGRVMAATLEDAAPHISTGIVDGANSRIYLDGKLDGMGTITIPEIGPMFSIGGPTKGNKGSFVGSIARIIIYAGALSDEERRAIEVMLSAEYGIPVVH